MRVLAGIYETFVKFNINRGCIISLILLNKVEKAFVKGIWGEELESFI